VAFTEAERTKIRLYMGWNRFTDYPSKDALMVRAEGTTEETEVRSILEELVDIETDRRGMRATADAGDVDELRTDAARGILVIRQEGRMLVKRLAIILGDKPSYDAFSPGRM
jgi:hypothetical protein